MESQAEETSNSRMEEAVVKEHPLDDLSKQVANNLMQRECKPKEEVKYVSIQDQIKLRHQEELAVQAKLAEDSQLAGVHGILTPISAESTVTATINESSKEWIEACSDMNPLVNDNTEGSSTNGLPPPTEKKASNLPSGIGADIDSSLIMSIPKSSSTNQSKGSGETSLWSDAGDFTGLLENGISDSQSAELDVLTAISGADVASSLPNVLDGLSEGEVSSDSDCDVDTTPNSDQTLAQALGLSPASLTKGRPMSLIGRSPLEYDPFYKTHQMIMRSKRPEQIEQMNSVLSDIQNIVGPSGQADPGLLDKSTEPVTSPIWRIRDTYADSLREQEEKRKKRMELEKRYEAEYRQQHLDEIYQMDKADHMMGPVQIIEEDNELREPINTDYTADSSDEDDDINPNQEGGGAWGWPVGSKQYSRLSNNDSANSSPSHGIVSGRASGPSNISNASRLAHHEGTMSPTRTSHQLDSNRDRYRKNPFNKRPNDSGPSGDTRLSTSSLNSYSSSSLASSSVAASTVIRKTNRDSDCSSTSSDSWDSAPEQPPITLSKSQEGAKQPGGRTDRPANEIRSSSLEVVEEYDTDEETDKLLTKPYLRDARVDIPENDQELAEQAMKNKAKEVTVYDPDEPTVLIEGILFRAAYLGSTQLLSEPHPSKAMRMIQAQEAVGRIKSSAITALHFGATSSQAADGESQPSTDVDLFVSTEKVMVLNTDLKEIMMDHALRSISYIADIDRILVIMAKRSMVQEEGENGTANKQQKLICHIFETDEAHLIAQSIGQAFQVAYTQFLKANGIDEPALLKDTSYEDILEQQEIMHDELEMFTRKDMQKEVVVPKSRGEILGVVIVESGWGSVLPTVTLANMSPTGPAARCGQLNIGDQIMSVNGISLVGLPLSTCQEHIRATKNVTAVRLCVVSRTPVIEVLVRRPDKKYQLGFSVQNGVICSLLRGGIAERGGVRVGHRIIEINGKSVVAVTHDSIVHMLSTSIGEIHMKTMPMAVFKLLTGQETPQYI